MLGEPRIVIVAGRDLWAGEQITYNYHSDTLNDEFTRQQCLCGARRCSGFIGGRLRDEENNDDTGDGKGKGKKGKAAAGKRRAVKASMRAAEKALSGPTRSGRS